MGKKQLIQVWAFSHSHITGGSDSVNGWYLKFNFELGLTPSQAHTL